MVQLEELLVAADLLAEQQLEARLGGFELVALVLQVLHLFQHALAGRPCRFRCRTSGPPWRRCCSAPDISLMRILRAVADALGGDVLVGAGVFLHRVDVHAALVGEGAAADIRLAGHEIQVGGLVDVPADFGEALQRAAAAGSRGRISAAGWRSAGSGPCCRSARRRR